MKVLWLVTARSGSKSIPHKNIRLLAGIPLLAHRIISAKKSKYPNDVWISTDDVAYATIAENYGALYYFLRPKELALDSSNSIDVVLHAMEHAEENGFEFDLIGLLEPTSPFITAKHLNEAIELLISDENAYGIVAVKEARPNTIFIQDEDRYLETLALNLSKLDNLGRQSFKKQITPSGGFYIARWNLFMQTKSFYTTKTLGFLVDDIASLEIDEPMDFDFAEFVASRKPKNV
jgi:CMP-N-acetylneuraminic acid synthetase